MLQFVHHKVKTINETISSFNSVQNLLAARSFQFDAEYEVFQQRLIKYFQETGNSSKEAEVVKIHNLLSTVRKGFDPVKLERIATGKREIYWGFAFHSTDTIFSILQELYEKENRKLEEAEEILSNLVLNLIQAQVLTRKSIKTLNSLSKIENFWTDLTKQNDSVSLIDKKLRMQLISEDIFLLLEKIITKIQ